MLTCSGHLDTLRFLAWFADPCRVVGSNPEAVPSQRLQARADVVGCAFATGGEFSPTWSLTQAFWSGLHNVALHSFASVVAGTRPGQDQGHTCKLGNDWLRCWWVRSVCRQSGLWWHEDIKRTYHCPTSEQKQSHLWHSATPCDWLSPPCSVLRWYRSPRQLDWPQRSPHCFESHWFWLIPAGLFPPPLRMFKIENAQIADVQIRWARKQTKPTFLPCPGCKSSSRPPGQSCSWTHSVVGPALPPEPPPDLVGLETALVALGRIINQLPIPSAQQWTFYLFGSWKSPFSAEAFAWRRCSVISGKWRDRWAHRCKKSQFFKKPFNR